MSNTPRIFSSTSRKISVFIVTFLIFMPLTFLYYSWVNSTDSVFAIPVLAGILLFVAGMLSVYTFRVFKKAIFVIVFVSAQLIVMAFIWAAIPQPPVEGLPLIIVNDTNETIAGIAIEYQSKEDSTSFRLPHINSNDIVYIGVQTYPQPEGHSLYNECALLKEVDSDVMLAKSRDFYEIGSAYRTKIRISKSVDGKLFAKTDIVNNTYPIDILLNKLGRVDLIYLQYPEINYKEKAMYKFDANSSKRAKFTWKRIS